MEHSLILLKPKRDVISSPLPVHGESKEKESWARHSQRGISFSFGILGLSRTSRSPRAERSQRRKGNASSILHGDTGGQLCSTTPVTSPGPCRQQPLTPHCW